MPVMQMQASLALEVGTRLYYACPAMSPEDVKTDRFFKKYKSKEATVVGFQTEYVGPLDYRGRMPGAYYTDGLKVRFDGEDDVHAIKPNHFIVLGPARVTDEETSRYAGELPQPIQFYPGDVVAEISDSLNTPRVVCKVSIQADGTQLYHLFETDEELRARGILEENTRSGKGNHFSPNFSYPHTKVTAGQNLTSIQRGNVHCLYTDPTELGFASAKEEVNFWAQEGMSHIVFSGNPNDYKFLTGMPRTMAVDIITSGLGDLLIKRQYPVETPVYQVRRLHDCFGSFRSHVRALEIEAEEVSYVDQDLLSTRLASLLDKPR